MDNGDVIEGVYILLTYRIASVQTKRVDCCLWEIVERTPVFVCCLTLTSVLQPVWQLAGYR